MRTDKHKLTSLDTLQETQFLEVVCAYQNEKNYFSDRLSSALFNKGINFKNNCSYREIRDRLIKEKYCSKYQLPARLWKMALKEAYELHIRTYEAKLCLLKNEFLNKFYRCFYHNSHEIHSFKTFFEFAINSAFYNYSSFKKVEQRIFGKHFYQAKIYERTAQYLSDLFPKAITKKILTQIQTQRLSSFFLKRARK